MASKLHKQTAEDVEWQQVMYAARLTPEERFERVEKLRKMIFEMHREAFERQFEERNKTIDINVVKKEKRD